VRERGGVTGRTDRQGLAIGEIAMRTGLSEGTLRMWEHRHAFPRPTRLASGHRRYDESDVDLLLQVLRERDAGLSVAAAIVRVRESASKVEPSIFAGLRLRRPELQAVAMRKPLLLALTRAIEDESCARAERPLLIGSFQRERFYRQSQRRWREFARTAEAAIVFADFERPKAPADGPMEVPIDRSQPLAREWGLVCEAPGHAVCLAAIERVHPRRKPDRAREFEVIWSVEPALVRAAVDISLQLAREAAPEMRERIADPSRAPAPGPPSGDQLRLATTIATRTLGGLSHR
jgi:MerR family transcriptional regulator, light-induced transcriptional regulator